MDRQPVVSGRFYEANPVALNALVDSYLAQGVALHAEPTLLAMVPHAGYIFSGAVCGKTLGLANLASTILLLGPNHTGQGDRFALWPGGAWAVPSGALPIDMQLAKTLLDCHPLITANSAAHLREHSLEVILPFLLRLNPKTTIVPIAVSAHSLNDLEQVGMSIGKALKAFNRPVSIIVSSDMSHYITHEAAKKQDALALEAAVNLKPAELFNTVRTKGISMCGVLPMTVGLHAALALGATKGELVAYATSGEVSGDYDQVVGYAGVLVR